MNSKTRDLALAFGLAAMISGNLQLAMGGPSPSPSAPSAIPGHSIYQSTASWDTTEGKSISLSALQGSPVVVAMVYTGCQAACPTTMADLKRIENGLPPGDRKRVKFAVFSFDSIKDTPARLKAFMTKHPLDLKKWAFFHGTPESVQELAALLAIRFKPLESGDFDHSNVITVLDSHGVIVHRQIGLRSDPQGTITALSQLLKEK
jgi:protein SCO1/2